MCSLLVNCIPICFKSNLGQLVLPDLYNCNAMYTLQNKEEAEPKLSLIQKENQVSSPIKSIDVTIPQNVGEKLKQLLRKENQQDKTDVSSLLAELKNSMEAMKIELTKIRQEMHKDE